MKDKNYLNSLKCAINGILTAFNTEKNFAVHWFLMYMFLAVNVIINISPAKHFIFIAICAGLFATECINTSIENMCDLITSEVSDKVRIIKDISAGAVLCWGDYVCLLMKDY